MNALRNLVAAYAAELGVTPRAMIAEALLGLAATFVLAIDAILFLVITGGSQ